MLATSRPRTSRDGRARYLAGLLGAVVATVLATLLAAPPGSARALAGPANRTAASTPAFPALGTVYRNPVSASFRADTFADPSVIRAADGYYYAYGTTDPLRSGEGRRHIIPMARSADLAHWTYVGDAFTEDTLPSWADRARDAALWAPDIRYVDGQYRLYYVVTETTVTAEPNDNAIGMATAPTPTGPWTDSGGPVVGPRRGASGAPGDFLWTFDPTAVRDTNGTPYLFYGSYYGGIWVSRLNAAGTRVVGDARMVAIDNKFEGAYVVRRAGYWYLFASAANCCAGPTTGYSVLVGRSRSLTGPYVDRDGVPLVASRAGGTPVLYQNGNRWVGAGHNAIATDRSGQDWIVYHAIDRTKPYLDQPFGINRRPMLLDRLDWVNGWPMVRFGLGPSDTPQPGPSAAGAPPNPLLTAALSWLDRLYRRAPVGPLDRADSDEFTNPSLAGWTWVRPDPAAHVTGGELVWPTEAADLVGTGNNAGVLLRPAPAGRWTAETKVTIDLGTQTVRNFQQAGLIAYVDDDQFVRLSHVAIFNTRQTEFGKEMPYAGKLSYGGEIIGPPAETTWLRLSHSINPTTGEHQLRAWTSRDGRTWVRGGVWTLPAGARLRIGLISLGRAAGDAPATARFDYLRFYRSLIPDVPAAPTAAPAGAGNVVAANGAR